MAQRCRADAGKEGRGVKVGPAPKPTVLKLLEGNRGKRKLKPEPRPLPITPDAPDFLGPEAGMEWRRVVPELERMGLMTLIDGAALAGYCQSYARWIECEKVITDEGFSYETFSAQGGRMVRARPEVRMGQAYLDAVRKFATEFGFTPASRSRVSVPDQADDTECAACGLVSSMCGCG